MSVFITQEAQNKLTEIYEYYKDLSKGRYGRKVRSQVIAKALKLKNFPLIGQLEESLEVYRSGAQVFGRRKLQDHLSN